MISGVEQCVTLYINANKYAISPSNYFLHLMEGNDRTD